MFHECQMLHETFKKKKKDHITVNLNAVFPI